MWRVEIVDSPRKRKATGPQQPAPAPSTQARTRSPPFGQLSNPGPNRRRGHSRQRSDISSYRSSRGSRGEVFGSYRGTSPTGLAGSREGTVAEPSYIGPARSSAHSVSSLLSDQPSPRFSTSDSRIQQPFQGEPERRVSPASSGPDELPRGRIEGPSGPRE
jgi:hypothetical protein